MPERYTNNGTPKDKHRGGESDPKKIKHTYKFTLYAISDNGKPTVKEFKKGMGAGVLATQEVEVRVTDKEHESSIFEVSMYRLAEEFKDEMIRVDVEEVL